VCLVDAHALRQLPSGAEYVAAALERIKAGEMATGVHGVDYAPKASEAFVTIATPGDITEVLVQGPRASGKRHR